MQVSITRFRRDLFRLADKAIEGERIEFVHRGVVFQVTPENVGKTKLDRLVGQPTIAGNEDSAQASKELLAEMEAAWRKDWDEL